MPDKAYTVPSTGETRYKHITSSQQRLMSKLTWERTVARARREKETKECASQPEVLTPSK